MKIGEGWLYIACLMEAERCARYNGWEDLDSGGNDYAISVSATAANFDGESRCQ